MPEERKRMLERLESGATHSDLKAEFKIRDSRTLEKQLRHAREEQALRVARTEIIKESLRDHMAEVRSLIETWSSCIKAPSPPSSSRYPLSGAEQTEQNRLFEGIRQHLPFPELWKSYQTFKEKWDEYLSTCEQVHCQVVEEANTEWGLDLLETEEFVPRLTSAFSWETLDRAIKLATGIKIRKPQYLAALLPPESNIQYLTCDGRVILYYAGDAQCFADKHWTMIGEWGQYEKVANLVRVLEELRSLAEKIYGILEEALLRRDYILHTCRLCPGEGKLAFK